MTVMQWVMKPWRMVQRRIDMTTLWPECKRYASDLDHAKAAFYMHVVNDPAWTWDYTDDELSSYVDALR